MDTFIRMQYGVLLVVCFLLEISGVAYLLNNGTLWSNVTWWLRDRFYELIYVSDTNAREARILRIIQEEVKPLTETNIGFNLILIIQPQWYISIRLDAAVRTVRSTISMSTSQFRMNAGIKQPVMNILTAVTYVCHVTWKNAAGGLQEWRSFSPSSKYYLFF